MRTSLVVASVLIAFGIGGFALRQVTTTSVASAPPAAPNAGVVVPDLVGDAVVGATAYVAKCESCHGENGVGVDGAGPPFLHPVYKPSHHGDAAFYAAALNGARAHHWPFGDMPPVAGITEAEVATIISYVRQLQAANGIF